MKKIIIAFISMLSMLIFIASPLFIKPIKANAALPTFVNEPQPIFEDLWSESINNENYVYSYNKLLTFTSNYNTIKNTANYFSMTYKQKTTSSYDYQNMCFYYDSADVTIDGNHIVIDNMVNGRIHSWCTYDNTDIYHYYLGKIDFDFDTFTFKFWDENGETYDLRYLYQASWPVTDIWNVYTNIEDISSSGGSIDVTFNPSLTGVVTRSSINDNGVSGLSNYFSMDITNNTAYGCQYRMMIKDTNGQPVTTYTQGDSDTDYQPYWETGFSVNDDGSFVFINDEWIYVSPTIGGGVCKALKPSEWHYISSGDSVHQDFSWSQFDFKKDHTYICMVYAITNDLGCATALDSYRAGLAQKYSSYCLDFTTQALVYQTVFTISNPATFNPNDTSFGNKIRNGNWSGDKGQFSAYENPSNGQLISGNGNVNELRDLPNSIVSGGSHGGGGYSTYHDTTLNSIYGGGSGTYTSNRSFAQLNSYFGGYFGFLSSIIGFYPSPYQTLIMIGFAGLVVIGILKAAIK